MDAAAFEQVYQDFHEFHAYFAGLFGRRETRERSGHYLQALLVQSGERRNAENLAESGTASVRGMQRFLTDSPWDDDAVIGRLQEYLAPKLEHPEAVWVVDGSDFPKQGRKSVGVARQYCGRLGKVAIHEVYPGHFVHHLHNNYGRPLPLVNRVTSSYAFTEGWAHYTEEMMLETEYARGQAALQVTQLLEALVRNCRYLCALGMHTQGMTVDEATQFFMDNAYMEELPARREELPARREALRGTFDPGYLNYTLGKLMILKLRDDYRREQGAAYSLKGFHDRLLSYGAPPLLREVMLADPGDGPL